MMVTVIGRGHSGTRSMSHTLSASGVYMGEPLNVSGDLIPAQEMYEACRIFGKFVEYKGNMTWDFSKVLNMEPVPEFKRLVESFLHTVLESNAEHKGWKLPETILAFPWMLKMFPDIKYIFWVRDPRDCILGPHVTDDLADFNIEYDKTDDVRLRRAISWKYQREIYKATPKPKYCYKVKFEDMVFNQDETCAGISEFLGIPINKIEMRPDSVGRYKTAEGVYMYDFFKEDMDECGYEY
ncbi:MAG: sulfotransferase [Oscillospiraceae bacterium]|nr:sulfotransferase [Oscillospiraceae bacterium]